MQAKRAAHDKHIDKAKETGHGIAARRRRRPTNDAGGDGLGGDGEEDDGSEDGEDHGPGGDEYGEELSDDEETAVAVKTRKKPNSKPKPGGTNVDAFNVGKFRDDDFFLDVTPRGVNHTELGLSTMEDNQGRPMQDHLSLEGALADATMDIVEEDGKGINQQRRVRIWDKKKRNYVQVNASEVGASGKRIKTESGAVVKKDAKAAGEVYKKWQLRTHRSISATGSQGMPRWTSWRRTARVLTSSGASGFGTKRNATTSRSTPARSGRVGSGSKPKAAPW